jgi:iron complex outermembrane receptor protein
VTESPITPRFGAQYQLTPNDLLYVTAAKGYRTGGVNTIILANLCGPTLANLGLTVNDVPTTFGSDTIWSYEAGEKFRLFNGRVQLNSSAYIIDWSNLQLTVPNLGGGCGGGWVQNAGKARSQGFDLDFQARPFPNLTLTAAVGYTKAEYTEQASLPKPLNGAPATVIVRKGDPLPIPPWQVNLGVQYDMPLSAKVRTYARVDYTYSSSYLRGTAPGVTGYAADTAFADSAGRVNLRVGARVNGLDLSLFANNVLNSKDALATGGGRTGCSTATGAACTSFTGYDPFLTVSYGRPREIGAQVSYRY